ncbi:SusC/RagA family TonB-linked outer membrane protein [Pedobacter cryophilus]|uniref:TonB-dependent receptor n=1 Tax=Pedobacter cryophilus TaxID=2571271 RepID=A0A4U1C0H6_9SPHI|nr:TonB-dependent receptor [Pedobacter cryophilus]TKB99068.1 TonB-dependent receptor [Pedobacter cryophilus]
MKFSTFLLLLLVACKLSVAQQSVITGKVISDDDKLPLPGVGVKVYKSDLSTTTNLDGTFKISAKPTDILIFSFLGFETKNITVGNQKTINVSLIVSNTLLEEVAIVGYGSQKKVNLTGSVQTLRLDSAVNTPVTNTAQLMYGKFSGVQLTQGNGLAGQDGSDITIRGLGTFGNASPLVVIDGMQFDGLNEFNRLAPSDIETITVLKDASAGAIYGARGANGVIVITTKQGNGDSFKIEYNNYVGTQTPTVVPRFLDALNYANLTNEKYKNLADGRAFNPRYTDPQIQLILTETSPFTFANTNWAEASLQKAVTQNHFVALSGGKGETRYRISLSYLTQDAIVKGNYNVDRYNFRANLNSQPKKWLAIGNNLTSNYQKIDAPTGGLGSVNDIISSFSRNAPTIPLYNATGGAGFSDGAIGNANASYPVEFNFVRTGVTGEYRSNDFQFSNRSFFRANILKTLSFESAITLSADFINRSDFRPVNVDQDDLVVTTAVNRLENNSIFNYRILNENLLRYNTKYKKNNFNFLLGYSTVYAKNDGFSASQSKFPSNAIQEFEGGASLPPTVEGNGASENAIQSVFGRMNYNFNEKYLFEVNVRRDGSSKFNPSNRYGVFPSVSAGWRISQEKFMSKILEGNFLTNLKLRGSWGRTGNNGIGNYIFSQTYNAGLDYVLGNSIVSGVALTSLANPTIKWETTEQYDIGLDASFFKNKLSLEADYFNRNSYDILYTNFPIPLTLGVNSLAAQNSASMVNKGLELNLNYTHKSKRSVSYNVGLNVTKNAKNRVTDLGNGVQTINNTNIIRAGDPFNSYYGLRMIGIFQDAAEVAASPVQYGNSRTAAGDIKYADVSGPNGVPDGVIDDNDRTVIGNPYPIWLYGLNSSLNYKGFSLSVAVQGVANVDRLLKLGGAEPLVSDRDNALDYWRGRWTPESPSTTLPRLGGVNNDNTSTFYIQDASYLRLRNVELGYDLPKKLTTKMKISGLRFFVSGQNLLTFTEMENYDPERAANSNARLVPLYKSFTGGLNFTL